MKRSLFLVLIGLCATFTAVADDRPVADAETIAEFKQFCEDMAADEGTNGLSLPEYLLTCVNEELDAEGYQPIAALPQ